MTKYTIQDVKTIIPAEQTESVTKAVERYLNEGVVPPFDPCLSCEPNHIRKLISLIQTAERHGLWPPKREATDGAKILHVNDNPSDPDVDFTEVFSEEVDWAEGGYVAGTISKEELDSIKEKRSEMFSEGADWGDETLAEAEDQD